MDPWLGGHRLWSWTIDGLWRDGGPETTGRIPVFFFEGGGPDVNLRLKKTETVLSLFVIRSAAWWKSSNTPTENVPTSRARMDGVA